MSKITRHYVEETLLYLGAPIKILGFKYITDAVMLLAEERPERYSMSEIYNEVARINGSSYHRVERDIRHMFGVLRAKKSDHETLHRYIGVDNCDNGNSLHMLYRTIKNECEGIEEKPIETTETTEQMIRIIIKEELKSMFGKDAVCPQRNMI